MAQVVVELDDASLVRAVQDGDPEAFALLFRRHYPTVRRVCARRMADPEEADDVAQAAFVRAYERIDRCAGDRRFGAWVQVIALRLCADVWRARTRTMPMEDPLGDDRVPGPNDCEDALLRRERAAEVRRALAALPDRQREVIVARDVEGRGPRDIAAALAVSVGTVDSLLMRARRRMVAACRATGTEQGAVSASVSTASAAAAALADERPLGRVADGVAAALARVLSGLSTVIGGAPGAPAVGPRVAEVVAAGALALTPLVTGTQVVPPTVAVPAVTVPAPAVAALPAPTVALPAAPATSPAPPATLVLPPATTGTADGTSVPAAPPVAAPADPVPVPAALAGAAAETVTAAVGGTVSTATGAVGVLLDAVDGPLVAPSLPEPPPAP